MSNTTKRPDGLLLMPKKNKDPAFLFYSGDFMTGTQFFSHEQVGKYMRLLMAQHQHGHLSEKQVLKICETYDEDVISKFSRDGAGNFFNERLEKEIVRRQNFVDSRVKNRKGNHTKDGYHMSPHMENENENEIVNGIKTETATENRKGVEGENQNKPPPDFTKPDSPGAELVYPFDTDAMRKLWARWKESRWHSHNVTYTGPMSEQADLTRLDGLNFHEIRQTILAAIAGKWKNLYPEQTNKKTNGNASNKADQIRAGWDAIRNEYGDAVDPK